MLRAVALAASLAAIVGCFSPVIEPAPSRYHNPLDVLDGGPPPDGGSGPTDGGLDGGPVGPNGSVGSVDGRGFDLVSSSYQVVTPDGGPAYTLVFLADAPGLCGLLQDGGVPPPWNMLRLHLAGAQLGSYPVAPALPPSGAIAEFDWEDGDGGSFGIETAQSGSVTLLAVDPNDQQSAAGRYEVDFADAGSLAGHFTASPCAAVPAQAGE